MAYDYSKNIKDEVSFEMAKLVGRERVNNLGSQELVVDYHKVAAKNREEAVDWLEANRLSVTDPEFSYKTYEGTWNCVSITYNEDTNVIRQVFKIDSQVGDLGDWDGNPPEPTWSGQSGDVSRISDGVTVEKSYYWRVTNPNNYNLPPDPIEGEIWTKTANDNGDGTYDVVIAREVANDQDGSGKVRAWGEGGQLPSTSIFVSGGRKDGSNGEYTLYYEYASIQQLVPAESGLDGVGYYDTGTTSNNGEKIYKTEGDTYALWNSNTDSMWYITVVAEVDTSPSNYFRSDTIIGEYEAGGTFTGDLKVQSSLELIQIAATGDDVLGSIYAEWRNVDDSEWRVAYGNYGTYTAWWLANATDAQWGGNSALPTVEANHPFTNLNSSEWYNEEEETTSEDNYRHDLIIQIGKNPPASVTTTSVSTNTEEQAFEYDGGEIADPVAGEDKSIQNTPLENGKFRTTITSTVVNQRRVPALIDSIVYASAGNPDKNAMIVGMDATYEQFQKDVNLLYKRKSGLQNSVSVNINRFGRYDYTIRAIEVGV